MTANPMATQDANDDPLEQRESLSLERLSLTNFRNYAGLALETGPAPVVLAGENGAGKTNILEAISLLMPGSGMRRVTYSDLSRASDGSDGGWAVAARIKSRLGTVDIGTGIQPVATQENITERSGRIVRINGDNKGGSGVLAHYVDMVWVTPAMDGIFTGPAASRRRLLDRLVVCFDPAFRVLTGRFERATQSRNRLLADGVFDPARLEGFEIIMAQTGTAIAAARVEAISALADLIERRRRRDTGSAFPWSKTSLNGTLEQALVTKAAVDVEDEYLARLNALRERDRAAGRTLEGPHRSDLTIIHGPKDMPARLCSTGEQKVLLIGLILAQAELITRRHDGCAPIVLLDEVAAHLDIHRRTALFDEILKIKAQAWMTGTDIEAFEPLRERARFLIVSNGAIKDA